MIGQEQEPLEEAIKLLSEAPAWTNADFEEAYKVWFNEVVGFLARAWSV